MLRTPNGRGLGRLVDLGDIRDFRLVPKAPPQPLPDLIDLTAQMPSTGDQGQLGSCTAWMAKKMYEALLMKQGFTFFDGSALAQYYWTRELEHTTLFDSGATIRDAIKTTVKRGVAPESIWPYDVNKFARKPTKPVEREALRHQSVVYSRVPQDMQAIRALLAQGYAIGFGVSVYESFESGEASRTGVIPMPHPDEKLLGGHAIYIVGAEESKRRVKFGNHWGDWGERGYGYMPYEYVETGQLASDFWVIQSVEG